MKVDFDLLKTNISLPDFLRDILGWKPVEGFTYKNPKMQSPGGDQTIIIKKNAKDFYTYWDVHNDKIKGSTILDIMIDHVYKETGRNISFREAGEILQTYVDSGKTILPEHSDFKLNNELLDQDYILRVIQRCEPLKNLSFLTKRGIDPEVLQTREWKGAFMQRQQVVNKEGEVKVYENTCIRLVNPSGIQGISQRNEYFKGALGSRYDTIASSMIDRSSPIKLHLCESILDGLAYYQMHYFPDNKQNVLFVSSEGSLCDGQINTIQTLINHNSIQSIELNYDNDLFGLIYTIKSLNLDFNNLNEGLSHISISKGLEENDKRIYIGVELNNSNGEGEGIFQKLFQEQTLNYFFGKENVQIDRINDTASKLNYQVSFPRSVEYLKKLAENIIEYKFGQSLELKLPVEKDFNDDLKKQIENKQNINNQLTI
ncbi:MAG: hypothetical protein LBG80_04535 [Bacteroidales bacterium]|jgi:hypothetical protein|nr:hypothetical protein [Bacteroidales bacterium]